ncbi:hypothetical protein E2C01_029545 [Portunus trituberculatus]|uniref:Uncharacterized protein n=1 Tax=Portunus trituberculatus TaxID=210409 RepID=A0A5B7ESJ0_PORTR|nr:hypothetical protein [Portunus trituberculatus]
MVEAGGCGRPPRFFSIPGDLRVVGSSFDRRDARSVRLSKETKASRSAVPTLSSLPRGLRWTGNVRGVETMQRRRPPSAPPPLIWPNKRHCWAGNRCHHYTPVLSHHARPRPVRHAFLISTYPSAPAPRRLATASLLLFSRKSNQALGRWQRAFPPNPLFFLPYVKE